MSTFDIDSTDKVKEVALTKLTSQAQTAVAFHIDVLCPFAFQTARWLRNVRDEIGITINFRFFSLEEVNLVEGKKHPWEREWSYGWSMMRGVGLLRRLDPVLLDRWDYVAGLALPVQGPE